MKLFSLLLSLCSCSSLFSTEPSLQVSHDSEGVSVEWIDNSVSWNLLRSSNLAEWSYVEPTEYGSESVSGEFALQVPVDGALDNEFYQLRKTGEDRIYVVGDSVSVWSSWPTNLAQETGMHVFSQAVGGTFSPSMVSRRDGVELVTPILGSDLIEAGTVQLRWQRYVEAVTHAEWARTKWAEYSKTVSEPDVIEVYQSGKFVGLAERSLKAFSTDYTNNSKTVYCDGHGLTEGARVVFISDDPNYPSDLSVLDGSAAWKYSSALLPSAIIERRVYYVANDTVDSFEVKEFEGDVDTMDLGSDSTGVQQIECGWTAEVEYDGADWDLTWQARTNYDDWIWLLEVSANDIPKAWTPAATVTIPNTETLLSRMLEIEPRYILVCPPSGSHPDRGPESYNWTNYYDVYMPLVVANYPNNHVDTMAVFGALRTQEELDLLEDSAVPELLWISGSPTDETSWVAASSSFSGATQMWVGPGYVPLQFRASLSDGIHLSAAGNAALTEAIMARLIEKGWWIDPSSL